MNRDLLRYRTNSRYAYNFSLPVSWFSDIILASSSRMTACQELRTSSAECTHDNLNLHGQVWLIWVDKKSTILSGVTEESIWDKKTEGTSRELDEHP